jgi:hypothetical protein
VLSLSVIVSVAISKSDGCVRPCSITEIHRDTFYVDVTDFGIVGDSITDNTDSLIVMIASLVQQPDGYWILNFPGGRYLYKDNTWLSGLRAVQIEGNGSEFQNIIETVPNGEDCLSLYLRGPHRKKDPNFRYHYNNGALFEQVSDTIVRLLDNGDQFNCGDLVLLSGYEQQYSGFPPNPRYFGYRIVSGLNNSKSILELSEPLHTVYSGGWGDYAWGADGRELKSGAPRIINLSTSDFGFPRHLEIHDLTFLPNPNCTIAQAIALPGEVVIFRNVHVELVYPQYNRKFEFIGGSVQELVEFDKFVDTILFENVALHRKPGSARRVSATAATSVNYLFIRNCIIDGPIRVSPRHLIVENTIFDLSAEDAQRPAIDAYNNFFPVYSVTVNNVVIRSPPGQQNSILGFDVINEIDLPTAVMDDTMFEFPDDAFYQTNLLRSIDKGTRIGIAKDGPTGVISAIRRNTSGLWSVHISWDVPPTENPQKLFWSQVGTINILHSTTSPNVSVFSPQREATGGSLQLFQDVKVTIPPNN